MTAAFMTDAEEAELLERGERSAAGKGSDFPPLLKLFTPDAGATWLICELDPEDPDIAFGLCDLGLGCPELGSVRLSEIATIRGTVGLPVERDRQFVPRASISVYAAAAHTAGYVVTDEGSLIAASDKV